MELFCIYIKSKAHLETVLFNLLIHLNEIRIFRLNLVVRIMFFFVFRQILSDTGDQITFLNLLIYNL